VARALLLKSGLWFGFYMGCFMYKQCLCCSLSSIIHAAELASDNPVWLIKGVLIAPS
jgi:hypothetical protein